MFLNKKDFTHFLNRIIWEAKSLVNIKKFIFLNACEEHGHWHMSDTCPEDIAGQCYRCDGTDLGIEH